MTRMPGRSLPTQPFTTGSLCGLEQAVEMEKTNQDK